MMVRRSDVRRMLLLRAGCDSLRTQGPSLPKNGPGAAPRCGPGPFWCAGALRLGAEDTARDALSFALLIFFAFIVAGVVLIVYLT